VHRLLKIQKQTFFPSFGRVSAKFFAEHVHKRWPHVLLMISSGYAQPQPGGIPDRGQFMPRPYGATTLVRHIHDLMRTLRR
jgi:hypothetical protein